MKQRGYRDIIGLCLRTPGRYLLALGALLALAGGAAAQSHVVVDGDVFGGGNAAPVSANTTVLMQGNAWVKGSVYGGGALASTGTLDDDNSTTVTIEGGTVGDGTAGRGNVFGGALGDALDAPNVNGTVTVHIGTEAQVIGDVANNVVVRGSVFGCNNAYGTPRKDVTVHIWRTKHTAGTDGVDDDGYALQNVFGGGNNASYIPAAAGHKATLHIHTCDNTIANVYGGGNAADVGSSDGVKSAVTVVIDGGRYDYVFGGGNGAIAPGANIFGDISGASGYVVSLTVKAGIIEHLFGGSNTLGIITGPMNLDINHTNGSCSEDIGEFFSGSNRAPITGDVVTTIDCGTTYRTVYGGSNQADITGNVTLNILGGTIGAAFGGASNADIKGNVTVNAFAGNIGELFGGNNAGGYIFGDDLSEGNITVNIDFNNDICPGEKKINFVYGGGNEAPYKPDGLTVTTVNGIHTVDATTATSNAGRISPVVNIISGYQTSGADPVWRCVDTAVFGGGKGAAADVMANPKVIIGADREQEYIDGEVVSIAPIIPNLPVVIGTEKNALKRTLMGDVFGGGNAAEVDGNTKVIIKGSRTKVWNNVYGGGNAAMVKGNTDIEIGSEVALSAPRLTYDAGTGKVTATSYGDFDFDDGHTHIYYTLDGSTPDPKQVGGSNPTQEYTAPVSITSGQNIRAIRYYNNNGLELTSLFSSYPVQPIRRPTISVTDVIINNIPYKQVTITNNSPGTELFYTTDGSDPDPEHPYDSEHTDRPTHEYSGPVNLTDCQTLKAVAHHESPHQVSNIASVTTPVATPAITIDGSSHQVSMTTATTGATLYYTTDGTQPDINNADATGSDAGYATKQYGSAFTLDPKATTVTAVAAKEGCPTSAEVIASIQLPAPSISITNGKVSITSVIDGVAIYYTTNGDNPNPAAVGGSNPTKYYNGTPFDAPSAGTTIKAMATKSGLSNSSVTEFTVPSGE